MICPDSVTAPIPAELFQSCASYLSHLSSAGFVFRQSSGAVFKPQDSAEILERCFLELKQASLKGVSGKLQVHKITLADG